MDTHVSCVGVHACVYVCTRACTHVEGRGQHWVLFLQELSTLGPLRLKICNFVCSRELYAYVCEIAGALGEQKRASDPLDLESVSGCELLTWIPGIELWFFARAVHTPSNWLTLPPALTWVSETRSGT